MQPTLIERWGGRKFILCSYILLASTAAYAFDKMIGGEWVTLTGVVIAAFSYGNAVEHKAKISGGAT